MPAWLWHPRRWHRWTAVVTTLSLLNIGMLAQPASAIVPPPPSPVSRISGWHVYTEARGECLFQIADPGMGMRTQYGGGHPQMNSYASVDWWDGRTTCGNTNATLGPNSFYVQQDLVFWNGYAWVTANYGPRAWNPGFQHYTQTGFGFPFAPRGPGWYYERVYTFDYRGRGAPGYSSPNVFIN